MARKSSDMFNADVKERFISTLTRETAYDRKVRSFFRSVSGIESSLGRDLSSFSTEEEISAVKAASRTKLRSGSRFEIAEAFGKYYAWCLENGVPGAVEHKPLPAEVYQDVNDDLMIFSPGHLQSLLDRMFDPESEETVDNVYRCFYWMAYCGLDKNSIVRLKSEHINLRSFMASINGIDVQIYQQAVPCLRNCVELHQFLYKHPGYSKPIMRDRVPGDYILRGVRGAYDDPDKAFLALKTTLSRYRAKHPDIRVSYMSCFYCGLFYRMREYELKNPGQLDYVAYVSDLPAGVRILSGKKEGYKSSDRKRLYAIASKLRDDYLVWKKELNHR